MTVNRIFCFCIISILFESCAIQVPPDGGKKDMEPPHLLSSEPANYSNLFKGRDIQLNFDEFISLNEIGSQLIVSPLLKYPPELKIRKKSLLIPFIVICNSLSEIYCIRCIFEKSILNVNKQ